MIKYYIDSKLVRTSKVATYTHAVININPNNNEWYVKSLCSGIDKAEKALTNAINTYNRDVKQGAKFDYVPRFELVELVKA